MKVKAYLSRVAHKAYLTRVAHKAYLTRVAHYQKHQVKKCGQGILMQMQNNKSNKLQIKFVILI